MAVAEMLRGAGAVGAGFKYKLLDSNVIRVLSYNALHFARPH